MITKRIVIPSMNDQQDARKVSQALYDVWGIEKVEVILERREARVHYNELAASFHDFEQAVMESGYEIEGADENAGDL